MAPNARVKPPRGGAADACKRSAKHAADATTWGRLERIVRRQLQSSALCLDAQMHHWIESQSS